MCDILVRVYFFNENAWIKLNLIAWYKYCQDFAATFSDNFKWLTINHIF